MTEKLLSKVPSLYSCSLKHFVLQMDLSVSSLNLMFHLRLLPPAILSDIYREVSPPSCLKLGSFRDTTIETETCRHGKKKKLSFSLCNKINLDLCCWLARVAAPTDTQSKVNEKKTLGGAFERRLKNKKRRR